MIKKDYMDGDEYLEFVMEEAKKQGKFFFLDSGEGNDFHDLETGWYIENFSGWLIDEDKIDKLSESKDRGDAYEEFSDEYVFAEWYLEGKKIKVKFNKY